MTGVRQMSRRSRKAPGLAGKRSVLDDPLEQQSLVAFDFDGTLTVRDSFTDFLAWRAGRMRYAVGLMRLTPAFFGYLRHKDRGRLKAAAVTEFLRGAPLESVEAQAKTYAKVAAPRLLRPDAVSSWKRWHNRGAKLVIVTASPDIVVRPFAHGLGADHLIGTRLAVDEQGRITGVFDGENCRGPEKVRRLQAMFGDDIRLAAAYCDTTGDTEMLQIADEKGFRVFNGRPN